MAIQELVFVTKMGWRIERDYRELKQELGLGDYEGRGWRGFNHHASLCIATCGFLISAREAIPPSGFAIAQSREKPPVPRGSRSNKSAHTTGAPHLKLDCHAA